MVMQLMKKNAGVKRVQIILKIFVIILILANLLFVFKNLEAAKKKEASNVQLIANDLIK